MAEDEFYWCRRHQRVEHDNPCGASRRMGPYPTAEAARGHAATAEARNEAWDAADEEWDSWGEENEGGERDEGGERGGASA
jgi:hypothetical protein